MNAHGLDASITDDGMLVSFSIPLYFALGNPQDHLPSKLKNPFMDEHEISVPPVVYFIETGRHPTIDATIDELFTAWLQEDHTCQAYCSHCYAHFTPVSKSYDINPSMSCTVSFPRNNPELASQCELEIEAYLDSFGVAKNSYYRSEIPVDYDPYQDWWVAEREEAAMP